MRRFLISFLAILLAFNVFAQEEEEFDVFDLDEETGEVKVPSILVVPEVENILPAERECLCQCLTRGVVPKNKKAWSGIFVDGRCVCPCLATK